MLESNGVRAPSNLHSIEFDDLELPETTAAGTEELLQKLLVQSHTYRRVFVFMDRPSQFFAMPFLKAKEGVGKLQFYAHCSDDLAGLSPAWTTVRRATDSSS